MLYFLFLNLEKAQYRLLYSILIFFFPLIVNGHRRSKWGPKEPWRQLYLPLLGHSRDRETPSYLGG